MKTKQQGVGTKVKITVAKNRREKTFSFNKFSFPRPIVIKLNVQTACMKTNIGMAT